MAKDEDVIVEEMSRARQIARQLFGDKCNRFAVEETFDYLQGAEDEEELAADLKAAIDDAKAIYEVSAPTPEEAFGVFSRRFGGA